jgi:hypothetical protein
MPAWLVSLLQILVFTVVILVVYNLLKVYLLSKIKVKKWIVLTAGLVVFIIPVFITGIMKIKLNAAVLNYVQMPLFVFFFLWYMDLSGIGASRGMKSNKKDDIKIKPKAKPNRVKHLNDK